MLILPEDYEVHQCHDKKGINHKQVINMLPVVLESPILGAYLLES
jgi:hypothetical protein